MKFKVLSANTIMSMSVAVKTEQDQTLNFLVDVNYAKDRVLFRDVSDLENSYSLKTEDYAELEQEILAYLRPTPVDVPIVSKDILEQIAKVRSGEYQATYNQQLPGVQ